MNLSDLLSRPTAIVTSEVQVGVLLQPAIFPALADQVADEGLVTRLAHLLDAARTRDVPIIHGVAHRRADGLGANVNARLFSAAARAEVSLAPGSAEAAVVADLLRETDPVSARLHGLGPCAGTDLDALLRNLGVEVVVVTGVSVNVAITNLVMDLVNLGYQVVLPTDAITGIPRRYANEVIVHTLSLLATVTTCGDLLATWSTLSVSDGSSDSA